MGKKLFIFEDSAYRNFLPLTYSRPTYWLLLGINTLEQKISFLFPDAEIVLLCRDYLKSWIGSKTKAKINSFSIEDNDQILLINGRTILDEGLKSDLVFSEEDRVYLNAREVVAISLKGSSFKKYRESLSQLYEPQSLDQIKGELKSVQIKAELVNYLWNLVELNGKQIKKDFKSIKDNLDIKTNKKAISIDPNVVFYNEKDIFIGEGSQIDGFVVLDAREGPIYIDKKVKVLSQTRIEGPCYIGGESIILGGMVREGNSFGPKSRIAGEVEKSIILG